MTSRSRIYLEQEPIPLAVLDQVIKQQEELNALHQQIAALKQANSDLARAAIKPDAAAAAALATSLDEWVKAHAEQAREVAGLKNCLDQLHNQIAKLEAENTVLRGALIHHQEQTRPIQLTINALEETK
jgi:regulator of replication initiation timing